MSRSYYKKGQKRITTKKCKSCRSKKKQLSQISEYKVGVRYELEKDGQESQIQNEIIIDWGFEYNKQQLRMARKRNPACHLCGQKKQEMATCSISRCSISYCYECIHNTFNPNFDPAKFIASCWICYSCAKACKCNVCKGVLPDLKKNPTPKPKAIKAPPMSQQAQKRQKPIESEQKIQKTDRTQQKQPQKKTTVTQKQKIAEVKVQHIIESASLIIQMQANKNCTVNNKLSNQNQNQNSPNIATTPAYYDHAQFPNYSPFALAPPPYHPYNYFYFYY